MRRTAILVFLSFCILHSSAQTIKIDKNISIGAIDSLKSTILNETRPIWVYVPFSGDTTSNEQERFPVVYLLDGDTHFFGVQSMILHMSELSGNNLCPKMILVGIPNISYESRTKDLTPTHSTFFLGSDSASLRLSGGGENFTSFIEKELIPYIDSKYPTAPYRTFMGHSFGGLLVLNTLLFHPNLFNSYVAIDPSLSWDNSKLLNQSKTILQKSNFTGKTLYLSIANTMEYGTDTVNLKKTSLGNRLHTRNNFKFVEYLNANKNNGLRWNYKFYKDDTHQSVPFISEYDAFRFIFDFYKCPFLNKLTDSKFNGDSAIVTHYKKISKIMGYDVFPSQPYMNDLGYYFIQQKQFSRAHAFFQINIDYHPTYWNAYDSMGDYYLAVDNKEKAIYYFKKSLSLKNDLSRKERLDKLINDK